MLSDPVQGYKDVRLRSNPAIWSAWGYELGEGVRDHFEGAVSTTLGYDAIACFSRQAQPARADAQDVQERWGTMVDGVNHHTGSTEDASPTRAPSRV